MDILEINNKITKLKEKIENIKLEIEWLDLIGEDSSVLLHEKERYENRVADLEKYRESILVESATKLSDEYYDKVLVDEIKKNLEDLKARLLKEKSLSEKEKNEVKALAKLQRNTGIINENLNRAGIILEAPKFSVFAVEDKKANDDTLTVGYDYKDILEMCESLLDANREKYFDIIFYNPKINMVKPELLNWYLEKFDIKSEIERIAKLPAYLIECISKENFDRLVKLVPAIDYSTDNYDKSLLSIILKSPYATEKFITDNNIFSNDYYISLVLSNPSISDDFKKNVFKNNLSKFLGHPEHFYYSMSKLNDEKNFDDMTSIGIFDRYLRNNAINFKNNVTGEADWMPDYKGEFFNNARINRFDESYDEFMKLISLRSVLVGNSLTYNRLDKYISPENLKKAWTVIGSTQSYLLREKVTNFSPVMYEYISDIIDALAVIYSRNGKLDEVICKLDSYKHYYEEFYFRPADINENNSNAYLYRLDILLGEKLKYYTEVKEKNQVLISSSDKMYCNDYTIDDIEKMYVKEVLSKKEGVSL